MASANAEKGGNGKEANGSSGVDVASLNASANGVLNAAAGMGAIAARIEAAVKMIQVERDTSIATIRAERNAAIAAIHAAVPPRPSTADSDKITRNPLSNGNAKPTK